MFIAGAIYYLSLHQNHVVASLLLGFAWTIKAPTSLILPAYLGAIQYNFGTKKLFESFFLILIT
jgi:hypothetical protein